MQNITNKNSDLIGWHKQNISNAHKGRNQIYSITFQPIALQQSHL